MAKGHQFSFPADVEKMLRRASDFIHETPRRRSAVLHELMDIADDLQDEELWEEIAWALVHASEEDDLTPQVSDHFVRDCPDEVFLKVGLEHPSERFTYWRSRANKLMKNEEED